MRDSRKCPGAERDRHKSEVRLACLKERQLDFRGVLGAVGFRIFGLVGGNVSFSVAASSGINGFRAQRRLPCSIAHDGKGDRPMPV